MTAFNASKHHIGLGPSGSQTGFTLAGGYRKDQQKEGQAQEFGGTFDLQESMGHSRWTQEDFSGGQYQYVWGRDAAMFRACEGMRPQMYDRTVATIPPMQLVCNTDDLINNYWNIASHPSTFTAYVRRPFYTFVRKGVVFGVYSYGDNDIVATPRAIVGMDPSGGTAWRIAIGDKEGFEGTYDFAEDILYVENQTDRRIDRYDGSTDSPTFAAATPAFYTYPTGIGNRRLVHMNSDGPRVTCVFGRVIADLTVPDDITAAVGAGSKYWAVNKRYRLPSFPVASCYYNNTLYILCSGTTYTSNPKAGSNFTYRGGWKAQVVSWNGTDLLPVVDFPYTFRGADIQEYAGRLFVSGWGMDYGDNEQIFGELYEVQATSIRAIRSFAPEHRNTASTRKYTKNINKLVVWEGLLWWVNEQGGFLEAYDITTDAFYGGPSLANIAYPATDRIDDLIAVGSGLFVMTSGPSGSGKLAGANVGDWLSRGKGWRLPPGSTGDPSFDDSWLETSDFAVEPARDKKWNKVTTLTKFGYCADVQYSVDGGETWTSMAAFGSSTIDGDWYWKDWDSSTIPAKRRCAFKFWFDRPNTEGFTEFVAFTATFNFLTTGKKAWQMTILGVDQPELQDNTKETQNVDTINDLLFGWHANGDKLVFNDLDGTSYNVRMADVSETQPMIGEELGASGGNRPEAFYHITLLEI